MAASKAVAFCQLWFLSSGNNRNFCYVIFFFFLWGLLALGKQKMVKNWCIATTADTESQFKCWRLEPFLCVLCSGTVQVEKEAGVWPMKTFSFLPVSSRQKNLQFHSRTVKQDPDQTEFKVTSGQLSVDWISVRILCYCQFKSYNIHFTVQFHI